MKYIHNIIVAILAAGILILASCSLVTVPVETAVKVSGTIAATGVKAATAPLRWGADTLAGNDKNESKD